MNVNYEAIEKAWFKPKNNFEKYIQKQCIHNEYKVDYEYFKTLFSKSTKEDVLMALTEKCEELQRLNILYYKVLCKEHVENNIISELEEWLKEQVLDRRYANDVERWSAYKSTLDKIQELKRR